MQGCRREMKPHYTSFDNTPKRINGRDPESQIKKLGLYQIRNFFKSTTLVLLMKLYSIYAEFRYQSSKIN